MKIDNKKVYLLREFASIFDLHFWTIRNYQKRGILPDRRLSNGYRYFTEADRDCFMEFLKNNKKECRTNSN